MKTILSTLLLVGMLAGSAVAKLSVDLTLDETDGRLWARVALAGIADCPTNGSVTVVFTSPNANTESSKYEASWRSCATTVGSARTRAYRTVRRSNGTIATGTWTVSIVSGTTVLATGTYEVH